MDNAIAIERIKELEKLLQQKDVEYQVLLEAYKTVRVERDQMIVDRTFLIA